MADAPLGVPSDGVSRDGAVPSSRVVVTTADKLRNLADWLDAHPDAEVSQIDLMSQSETIVSDFGVHGAERLAEAARSVGGRWEKDARANSDLFRLTQEILPGVTYELVAMREQVCERVVVGTREVEVPDPEAPKVTTTEEVVEWRCGPLLAAPAPRPVPIDPEDLPF